MSKKFLTGVILSTIFVPVKIFLTRFLQVEVTPPIFLLVKLSLPTIFLLVEIIVEKNYRLKFDGNFTSKIVVAEFSTVKILVTGIIPLK